ncbi:MAG: class I SAM-dependent methyltransferase [Acidobacteria bacterium]|nr:class I SAM-dependent methyltransferase [Acidobacteriota bacterium]MBI3657611.1 class I SAM-dependent methyltransferase [Acidobacteriota bacterium]
MSEHPKIFTPEYYQRLFDVEERHWWSIGMRAIAARMLDQSLPGRRADFWILDAGCGTGLTRAWLEAYARPERIIGIDLAWLALEFCRRRSLAGLAQASITGLPFVSDIFDLATCIDVLQHLPQDGSEKAALDELHRVLRPGGRLLLRTNAQRWLRRSGNEHAEDHYHRYTLSEIIQKVTQAGFVVERATHANRLMSMADEVKRFLKPNPPRNGADHGLAIQLPKSKLWNALLSYVMAAEAAYLAKPGRRFNKGHTLICLARKP